MDVVSLYDLERISKQRSVKNMWDFIDGAAFDEITKRRNEEKFRELTLNPSFLVDVSKRDMSTSILGEKISFPVMVAPAGGQRQHHPEGELATSRGAGMADTLYALPTSSGYSIRDGRRDREDIPWLSTAYRDCRGVGEAKVVLK